MHKKSILIVSLGLAMALAGAAQNLSKEEKVERILKLTNSQAMMDQMFDQMKAMGASQMAGAAPQAQEMQRKILEMVKTRMPWERIRPGLVKIYVETFSDEEISGMLAFYESPTGRAMIDKTPAVMGRTMAFVQAQMADMLPEILKLIKETTSK